MLKKINELLNLNDYFPLISIFICFLCYGVLTLFLGFFHDELSMLWFFNKMDNIGIFFEGNRPLLKLIYEPLLLAFGSNHLLWTSFSIFTRWLSAIAFYWILRQTWPKEKLLIVSATLAFLIYPGFQAQFSTMIFGIIFLVFSSFLFSIGLTIHLLETLRTALYYSCVHYYCLRFLYYTRIFLYTGVDTIFPYMVCNKEERQKQTYRIY